MENTILRQDKEWEIHKIGKRITDNGTIWYLTLSNGQEFATTTVSNQGNAEAKAITDLENLVENDTGLKTFTISNKGEGNLIAIKKTIKPVKVKVRK